MWQRNIMNEIKESNDLKSLVVAKEEKETNVTEFKSYLLPTEIGERLECEYSRLVCCQKCSFEDSLKQEYSIPSNLEYIISSLKKHSIILGYIDDDTLEKMERVNYRMIISSMNDNNIDNLFFNDLKAGIENLLYWECHFITGVEILKSSIDENLKVDITGDILRKVTIIFEDELKIMLSKENQLTFSSLGYNNDKNREWCCEEKDNDVDKLLACSSELLSYLAVDTISNILTPHKFRITAFIRFLGGETMKIDNYVNGFSNLLMFERYLKRQCFDWCYTHNQNFSQCDENTYIPFQYDKIEFAFEL